MQSILHAVRRALDALATVVLATGLNAPLLALVLAGNLDGVHSSALTGSYLAGVLLGYYLLPALVVAGGVALALSRWRRTAYVTAAATLAVHQLYLLVDSRVYAIYKFHLDSFWLNFLVSDFSGLGIPLSLVLTTLTALLAIAGYQFAAFALARRLRGRRWSVPAVLLLMAAGFVWSQVLHIVAYEKDDERITTITPHLPLYFPVSSHRNGQKYGDHLAFVEAGFSTAGLHGQDASLYYPREELTFAPLHGERGPNVLLILLESWRFDSWGPRITPHIHELAGSSTVFERHFSSGNSTVAGIFGMFYGLHPTYWTAVKANNVRLHNPVLVDALVDRGYDFGIFADSEFERHKIADTIFRGIEIQEEFEGSDTAERDLDLGRRLVEFLEARAGDPDPFFAMAFFKASHYDYDYVEESAPFRPARKMSLAFVDRNRDPEPLFNDYRNAVHFDDALIGGVLARMRELGLMENTVILVTTDHAESFNDNRANYWGHGSNFTQYQTRVPLIAYFPDRPPRRVAATTSHIDIPPTLMREILHCTTDVASYSDGVDLLGEVPESRPLIIASYVNYAVVLGDDVYESRPLGLEAYRIDDVTAEAAIPDPAMLREILHGLGRFYQPAISVVRAPAAPSRPAGAEPDRSARSEHVRQPPIGGASGIHE